MKMEIELVYRTNLHEKVTDLYSVLYSIIAYDVYKIIVTMGGIKKTFILEETIELGF